VIAGTFERPSQRARVAVVGAVFGLSAWVVVASIGLVASQSRPSEASERIRVLREANAELAFDAQPTRARQEATIAMSAAAKAAVHRQPEPGRRQPEDVTRQRGAALDRMRKRQQAIAGVEGLLDAAAGPSLLRRPPQRPKARLVEIGDQGTADRRLEIGLRSQLAFGEDEVADLRSQGDSTRLWLQDWVLGSVAALEDLVDETGVDLERLIARAARWPAPAQGGPLQVAAPDQIGSGATARDDDLMGEAIRRLALLQRVARTLPLAPPLDQFHASSPYGKRRDPFARTWAYHSGLDLGAPRNSEVLATAPGRVVFAGWSGPYGNLVEIDHGTGIVTRYAHLKSLAVEVGDGVDFRTPIGVIGTTGRSTSRHLHYEIRIDDQTLDPAKFLDAGRQMAGIFETSAPGEAE
jgi:murein DD-endopeptidase MepM/ murein hydrolase activator NlpD